MLPVISVHVPKTMGMSVRQFLESVLGSENVLLVYPERGIYLASTEFDSGVSPEIKEKIKGIFLRTKFGTQLYHLYDARKSGPEYLDERNLLVPPNVRAIHGHFPCDRFDHLLPESPKITIIRDPLDRMSSQYYYWKRLAIEGRILPDWFTPGMTLEQFALRKELKDIMHSYVGDLGQYAVVGLHEELIDYEVEVARLLGYTGEIKEYRINIGHNRRNEAKDPSETFKSEFYDFHRIDTALYNQALALKETKRELGAEFRSGLVLA